MATFFGSGFLAATGFFLGASSSDDESDEDDVSLATTLGLATFFTFVAATGFLTTSSSEDES